MALLLAIANSVWNGFVVSKLWCMFMVPIFGLPWLSVAGGIGCVVLLDAVVTPHHNFDINEDIKEIQVKILGKALAYGIYLAIGYIASLFM